MNPKYLKRFISSTIGLSIFIILLFYYLNGNNKIVNEKEQDIIKVNIPLHLNDLPIENIEVIQTPKDFEPSGITVNNDTLFVVSDEGSLCLRNNGKFICNYLGDFEIEGITNTNLKDTFYS